MSEHPMSGVLRFCVAIIAASVAFLPALALEQRWLLCLPLLVYVAAYVWSPPLVRWLLDPEERQ